MLGIQPIPADEPIDFNQIRVRNLEILNGLGFTVAGNLNRWTDALTLRPPREIAARLMALDALAGWCSVHDVFGEEDEITAYVDRNSLLDAMTADEQERFEKPRQQARIEWGDTIGWKQENMWPLAWVFGMDKPPQVTGEFIDAEIDEAIVCQVLPGIEETIDDLLRTTTVRPVVEVISMHDLFYCAHNAVRSAQVGRNTVPNGFDPIVNGGTIHERRHS
ncbi:MAG: DUF4272 domain-containing protein, partial [Planctomycetaceae bacterium]|nr:DUF4272 domain-containing protein [Planctomycetaceae bacterium]